MRFGFISNNFRYSFPKMSGLQSQFHPPYISPMLSPSSPSSNHLSPAIIFIIVIVAAIFFISSLIHLLVKYFAKYSSSSSISQSNRYTDFNNSGLQRQLQQLFHLHDSGIDQVLIDALPVFQYKEIVGSKEGFDCAVCLCEFSEKDKLRLLPLCSHAFHIDCIDKWLLSNSTCPLCRGTLFTPGAGLPVENPMFVFDDSIEENELQEDVNENGVSSNRQKPEEIQGIVGETTKFVHIRLGRFTSSNNNGGDKEQQQGETSNLDARRCYSMGSLQYVVDNTNLPLALFSDKDDNNGDLNVVKGMGTERQKGYSIFNNGGDIEGKKLNNTSKGESFSVSKIWLWSKKDNNNSSSSSKLSSSSHNFLV